MNYRTLRLFTDQFSLSQVDLAKLLGVTTRTVNLWATGQTSIPGPVQAYFRLFSTIPQAYREIEVSNVIKEQPMVKEGMYHVDFSGVSGDGSCTLVFENGRVFGVDTGGGKYDGVYVFNNQTDMIETQLQVSIAAGEETVLGVPPQSMDWSFSVHTQFPRNPKNASVHVVTPYGPVNTIINFLRDLPN